MSRIQLSSSSGSALAKHVSSREWWALRAHTGEACPTQACPWAGAYRLQPGCGRRCIMGFTNIALPPELYRIFRGSLLQVLQLTSVLLCCSIAAEVSPTDLC